jgi:hypothetical protein
MPPQAADATCNTCHEGAQHETVYVAMSENAGGVAGMVCATRQRAEWTASTSMAGKTTFILAGWLGMNVVV